MSFKGEQHAFTTGEVSPHVYARSDIAQRASGLKTMLNFLPLVQGPAQKRSGTKFIHDPLLAVPPADTAVAWRLIPFIVSRDEAYMLLVGDRVGYVYQNRAVITDTRDLTITAVVLTPGLEGITLGNLATAGLAIPGPVKFTTTGTLPPPLTTTGTYFLTLDSVKDYAVSATPGGTRIVLTGAGTGTNVCVRNWAFDWPYTASQFQDVQHAQSNAVMYFAHEAVAPNKLTLEDDGDWTREAVSFVNGPWEPGNGTDISMAVVATVGTLAVAGSTVTVTASGPVPAGGFFQPADALAYLRVYDTAITGSASSGVGVIQLPSPVVAGDSVAGCTIIRPWQDTTGVAGRDWNFGLAWTSARGYPAAVTMHEQRLFFAGEPLLPQTLRGSKTGAYENFSPSDEDGTVQADSAVEFTLDTKRSNDILWMASTKALILGTDGGIFAVTSASTAEAITATSIDVKMVNALRAGSPQPADVESALIFASPLRRRLSAIEYEFTKDRYVAEDVSILSDHILGVGVTGMAFQQDIQPILWCWLADGSLAALTVDSTQKVRGWSRHTLGGEFAGGDPVIESAAILPGTEQDDLWLVVRRTINGATKRYVEILEPAFGITDAVEDAFCVDCGIVYDGAATSTITGLAHLEGQTVSVLGDGAVMPDEVVASGSITLASTVEKASVGLPYTAQLETLPLEIDTDTGTTAGAKRRVHKIVARFFNTVGGKYGRNFGASLERFLFRTVGAPMDTAIPLFTGNKAVSFPGDYDEDGTICIQHDEPTPATVLSIMSTSSYSQR